MENKSRLRFFVEVDGTRLKALRKQHNLTQEEVANGIGTKKQRISEWETGRIQQISPAYQRLLEDFFEKRES